MPPSPRWSRDFLPPSRVTGPTAGRSRSELTTTWPGAASDVATIRAGLRSYCRNYGYLSALKAGAPRFDLDGNVAGVVSSEEAAHAREQLAEMLAPKAAKPEPKAEKAAAAASPPAPTMWPKLTLKRSPRAA